MKGFYSRTNHWYSFENVDMFFYRIVLLPILRNKLSTLFSIQSGGDDIDVANTLFNTAVLLDDIEKYELSLVAYKEALRIRKLVLGEHSPEVADNLFCMGNVATVVDNQQEALGFYKESIDVREALIHGDDHVAKELDDTLLFISNPTSPHPHLLPQYEKLNQSFEEALPLTKLIMGTNHPDVCDLLNRMGEVYMKLHDWDNAIGSFQG